MNFSIKLSKGKIAELTGEFMGTFFFLFALFLSPMILRGNEPLLVGFFYMAIVFGFGMFSRGHYNPILTFADLLVALFHAIRTKDYDKVKEEGVKFLGYFGVQLLAGLLAFALAYRLRDQLTNFQLAVAGYDNSPEIREQIMGSTVYGTTYRPEFQTLAFVMEMFFSMLFVLFSLLTAKYYKSIRPFVLGVAIFTFMVFTNDITGGSFHPIRSMVPALVLGGEYAQTVWLYIVAPMTGALLGALVYYFMDWLKPEDKKNKA